MSYQFIYFYFWSSIGYQYLDIIPFQESIYEFEVKNN